QSRADAMTMRGSVVTGKVDRNRASRVALPATCWAIMAAAAAAVANAVRRSSALDSVTAALRCAREHVDHSPRASRGHLRNPRAARQPRYVGTRAVHWKGRRSVPTTE